MVKGNRVEIVASRVEKHVILIDLTILYDSDR